MKPVDPPEENHHFLYYFPWLSLESEVRINQLALLPYPSQQCEEKFGKQAWLLQRLRTIHHACLDSDGKHVPSLTIVMGSGGPLVSTNDRQLQSLFHALDLSMNILQFRYRNYDSPEPSGLRLNMQCAALHESHENIYSLSRNWFHESWEPFMGNRLLSHHEPTTDIDFPVRRIREIFQALQNSDELLREHISLAIQFLKLANLDLTQLRASVCLELMAAAFEHLFEHPNVEGPDIFAFKLEDLWNYPFRNYEYHPSPFKNKQLKQVTKIQSFRLVRQPGSQKSWLQAWFLEFFKLRNDLMYKSPVNTKEYAWNITQHLRVATEILPMTILIMLSRDDKTRLPLKNEDEKRIQKVDAFIQYARSLWYAESHAAVNKPDWLKGEQIPNLWDSLPDDLM